MESAPLRVEVTGAIVEPVQSAVRFQQRRDQRRGLEGDASRAVIDDNVVFVQDLHDLRRCADGDALALEADKAGLRCSQNQKNSQQCGVFCQFLLRTVRTASTRSQISVAAGKNTVPMG